ncbi:MAG: type VI secretion system tube protein TssD [Candidatus Odinarchaeota archaeon]
MRNSYILRAFLAASVILVITSSFLLFLVNEQPAGASETSTAENASETSISAGGLNFHVWITGETQGWIKGGSTILSLNRAETIVGYQYSHNLYTPTDAASGLPTGKRVHGPITMVIQFDKSAPLLYTAWSTNEKLTEVIIRFYRPNPAGDGTTQQYFTVTLENAAIRSIRDFQQNTMNPDSYMSLAKEISLVYQKITWTWEPEGLESTDDWESPVV